jgi:hypothetical protein
MAKAPPGQPAARASAPPSKPKPPGQAKPQGQAKPPGLAKPQAQAKPHGPAKPQDLKELLRANRTYIAAGAFVIGFIAIAYIMASRPNDNWAFNKPEAQRPLQQERYSFH